MFRYVFSVVSMIGDYDELMIYNGTHLDRDRKD